MNLIPRISDTEWEVMRVIWNRHPATASEIIETLAAQDPSWHPKTVRTLLARLVRKRALDYEPSGRSYVYEPRATEEECVKAASESFLARVFGGSLKPMLAHFVEQRRLTRGDLEELHKLIERSKESQKQRRICK
jgi:BlaI family penicillinase repressor